jgi:hypothetical protein
VNSGERKVAEEAICHSFGLVGRALCCISFHFLTKLNAMLDLEGVFIKFNLIGISLK